LCSILYHRRDPTADGHTGGPRRLFGALFSRRIQVDGLLRHSICGLIVYCHCYKRCYRILIALAAKIASVLSEMADWTIMIALAQPESTGTSVGEKAVLVLKATNK